MSLLSLFRPYGSASPPIVTGRSGFYRLLLAQLQQEALDQYEAKRKKKPEEVVEAAKVEEVVEVVKAKPPKPKVFTPKPKARRFPEVQFKPAPVKDEFEKLPEYLNAISNEVRQWYKELEPLLSKGIEQHAKRVEAANDEDDEDLLLLIMAA